jgi:hypothetical protein
LRLTTCASPNGPTPSLPNPLRYAGRSQLLRASPPASPHRYSAPHGFRRLEPSLSPATNRTVSGSPSHVPYESLDRAHAAYMPDTTWAVSGYLPDSSRDKAPAPVLMSSHTVSTRQRQRTSVHRSSSRSLPDAVTATPFPTTLKTTVFSQRPSWWFEAFFRKTAPEGQTTSISHTAPQPARRHPFVPRFLRSCSQEPFRVTGCDGV